MWLWRFYGLLGTLAEGFGRELLRWLISRYGVHRPSKIQCLVWMAWFTGEDSELSALPDVISSDALTASLTHSACLV